MKHRTSRYQIGRVICAGLSLAVASVGVPSKQVIAQSANCIERPAPSRPGCVWIGPERQCQQPFAPYYEKCEGNETQTDTGQPSQPGGSPIQGGGQVEGGIGYVVDPPPSPSSGGASQALLVGGVAVGALALTLGLLSNLPDDTTSTTGGGGGGGGGTACSIDACTRSGITGNCTCQNTSRNTTCTGSTVGAQPGQCPVVNTGQACTTSSGTRIACCRPGTACTNGTCNTLC